MDYAAELSAFKRATETQISVLKRQVSDLSSQRIALRDGYKQVRLAVTAPDPDQSPTYPIPGATVFPFIFLSGGFPDAQGTRTPAYTERRATPNVRCFATSGEYIPEGTVIQVWQDRGVDDANPGEWWTDWTPGEALVFFQLYANKTLSTQPAIGDILAFNTTTLEWAVTGVYIYVHDDYYNSPGFFTGKLGVDRGWAKLLKYKDQDDVLDLYDHYGLVWMSGPAHKIRFTLTADRTSAAAEAVDADVDHTYLYGHDQLAPTSVWFPLEFYPKALTGAVGEATYDDRNIRYEVQICDQLCNTAKAVLKSDMCGNATTTTVGSFTVTSKWPFSQIPDVDLDEQNPPEPIADTWTVANTYAAQGQTGDPVWLEWDHDLDMFVIIRVKGHTINLSAGWTVSGTDITQYFYGVSVEICAAYTTTTIQGEDCSTLQ